MFSYTHATEIPHSVNAFSETTEIWKTESPTLRLHNSCKLPLSSSSLQKSGKLHLLHSWQKFRLLRMTIPMLQNSRKLSLLHSGCKTPVNCLSVHPAYRTALSCVSYIQATKRPHRGMPTPKQQNSHRLCLLHSGNGTPVNGLALELVHKMPIICVSCTNAIEIPHSAYA